MIKDMDNNSEVKLALKFREYSKNLSMLFAEDEHSVRNSTAKILERAFGDLTLAEDGVVALDRYYDHPTDIVLTDINMPNMNGIELIRKIREMNSEQAVVVLSAHNEAQYYYELINIGIDAFLLKPINLLSFMFNLSRVSKSIWDSREKERLQKELILQENRVIALSQKIKNSEKITKDEQRVLQREYNKISAKELHEVSAQNLELINDKLEPIDENLDVVFDRYVKNQSQEEAIKTSNYLRNYANILSSVPEFSNLAMALESLSEKIAEANPTTDRETMHTALLGISSNLQNWRKNVFDTAEALDIHYMDASMICDCLFAESILIDKNIDDTEVLFF